jgi:hypothetical protein
VRRWREKWPPVYEQLLRHLREKWSDGRGVREFIRILKLHQDYPEEVMVQAVTQALTYGCGHLDGVRLCLRQRMASEAPTLPTIDLAEWPQLTRVGAQPVNLACYDRLLEGVAG